MFDLSKIKKYIKRQINHLFAYIDKKSRIDKTVYIYRLAKIIDSQIEKYSYIGINTKIINTKIGKYCSIASNVYIGLEEHTIHNISTSPIFTESINATGHKWIKQSTFKPRKKTTIGNDVWIGYSALVKGGITIGDGAIIAAGAMVTKDVPPYAIVGGVPAKIIKYRFSKDIINELLKLKWWDMSDTILLKNIELFQKENISLSLIKSFESN